MTRRKLSAEERSLWQKAVERTDPIRPEPRAPSLPESFAPPKPVVQPEHPRFNAFQIGQTARSQTASVRLKPALSDTLTGAPVQMDRKAFTRMKRGKLSPEGRLDLHGMTLDRAHPALNRFILSCQSQGKRLVLVITGKGRDRDDAGPIPTPRGVLRHQVPTWLSIPPLKQAVLQITPAHVSHGGGGAYYVYLRKPR